MGGSDQGPRRVLLVDDDADFVQSMTLVLENAGLEVDSAMNGAEAIQAARVRRPDLIVLDMLMPKKDGATTFEELSRDEQLADIPVIFLTSVNEKTGFGLSGNDFETVYGKGPVAFLEKPVEAARLVEIVRRAIGGA